MNGSNHIYERVNESCHTYEIVMSHTCMSHVTYRNESCHNMNGGSNSPALAVRPVNESRHIYECVRSHI